MNETYSSYNETAINIGNHRIAVKHRDNNSADLVVFIHGLGCSSTSFKHVWDFLGLANTSLLAFDLPGFGLSDKSIHYSYSMEDQAQLCSLLLAQLPATRIHLVAHSMGGAIALLLTQKLLPASLINVEGNLVASDCGLISRKTIAEDETSFVHHGFAELCQTLSTLPSDSLDLSHAMPEAFHRSAKSLVEWSDGGALLNLFDKLPVPHVYVYGESNAAMPVLNNISKDTRKVQIAGSGHFPMIDNPNAFYAFIANFTSA